MDGKEQASSQNDDVKVKLRVMPVTCAGALPCVQFTFAKTTLCAVHTLWVSPYTVVEHDSVLYLSEQTGQVLVLVRGRRGRQAVTLRGAHCGRGRAADLPVGAVAVGEAARALEPVVERGREGLERGGRREGVVGTCRGGVMPLG